MKKKDNSRLVFFNNKFVKEKDAKISIYDSALMFGDMVFEMTRSFNKKQFMLKEHIERLFTGLKILKINIPYTKKELIKICNETVKKNEPFFDNDDEHRLMINVSRGPLGIYAPVFDNKLESTVIVADFPLKWTVKNLAGFFDTGVNSIIPSQRSIPATLMDPKIKNRSRMWYQMANIEVSNYKGENNFALLIDPDGFITEGTGHNFFMIKNNTIISPQGRNILRGITRDYIFKLAKQLKIKCIEKNIEPFDVYDSDECFITGTPFCILPSTSLNGIKINNGKVGNITHRLLKKWSKNVGFDIVKQIKKWANEDYSKKKSIITPYQFKKK